MRPFSGKLADLLGRKRVMLVGCGIAVASGAAYAIPLGVAGFLAIRFFHGMSAGFKPTGDTAFLADLIPMQNRGEALGLLGVSSSLGMALGPVLGSAIASLWGMHALFWSSSLIALLSYAAVRGLTDSLKPQPFKLNMLHIGWPDIFEKRVLAPAVTMLLTVFSLGMALTVIPDFSSHLGATNKGFFFTIMLTVSILTRLFAGKISDKIGRIILLRWATVLLALAMVVLALSTSLWSLYLGAALYGLSNGITSPTIFAWTVDLALPEKRGRSMTTLYIALECGVLLGAVVSAAVYANAFENLPLTFALCAGLALVNFAYLFKPDLPRFSTNQSL